MKKFLSEYWPWIVVPFVVVLGLLVGLWFLMGDDGGNSPFQYNLF